MTWSHDCYEKAMSISRRAILPPLSLSHVTFRCLNREFFFRPKAIKEFILSVWEKYKVRYGLKIFEFIIMDNHAHLLVLAKDAETLGNFMRITNSLIARFVNKYFGRDSHALRERYKSPLITTQGYLLNTIQYIWLNRRRKGGILPHYDRYCSFYYRFHGIDSKLLDQVEELPLVVKGSISEWAARLLRAALEMWLDPRAFEHSHTIGNEESIKRRSEFLIRLTRPPPKRKQSDLNDRMVSA